MTLPDGSRLGHYDVTALIAEGGMGQVHRATDTKLNQVLSDQLGALPSFQISLGASKSEHAETL